MKNKLHALLLAFALSLASLRAPLAAGPSVAPKILKVALVQLGLEATLEENRDKIVRLAEAAAAGGARLVVFPEGALAAPCSAPPEQWRAALTAIAGAARKHGVYLVTGMAYFPEGRTRHHNQLYVFSPRGETLLVYDKVWSARRYEAPKLVEIDGVPCSFIICADRWSRPLEGIPPTLGARVIIECSNNYDTEWIPQLQWYWYVPRAIRNSAYVIFSNSARENRSENSARGHGHSAVIAPDGAILAAAGDERDKIITADLDLGKATGEMALQRSRHPLFQEWWAMGQNIYQGRNVPTVNAPELQSSESSVKAGFGLMACGSSIERNVATIIKQIGQAAASRMDLLVFPELAVTGDREADIRKAGAAALEAAILKICEAAKKNKLTVVFGSPSYVNGKRRNSAYAVGPGGEILTRYDQIAAGRPKLFEGGLSTKAMWFQVNGVWSVVTIGEDALWTEMAEMTALRGARLHCHLRHDRNMGPSEALRNEQIVTNLASFRTLTIVANPLHPDLAHNPEASFSVGSGVWDDLEAGNWCAVKTVSGRPWEGVYSAPRVTPGAFNPLRRKGYWISTLPQFKPWMLAGAAAMNTEADSR